MADIHDTNSADANAYERGTMDISDQSETWQAFAVWSKWGTLGVLGFTFFIIFWLVVGWPLAVAGVFIAATVSVIAWFFESSLAVCTGVFALTTAAAVIVSVIAAILSPLFS